MPASNPKPVVVVGSANIDLVATAAHIPAPGETVLGDEFRIVHGGKGANQAVAAARLGATVALVGCVGDDDFGGRLRRGLCEAGVDCTHLRSVAGVASGVALIVVAQTGENAICVAAGANAHVSPADIAAAEPLIAAAAVCVFQLEVPIEAVVAGIALARRHGVEVLLDPAPAPQRPSADLLAVDVLTPNVSEASRLLGQGAVESALVQTDAEDVARALRRRGASAVVLKLGANGAFVLDQHQAVRLPAPAVKVVDTTGAGDAFTAALAVERARGVPLAEAARFAVAAGSAACTKFGAQPSMPARAEVERLMSG